MLRRSGRSMKGNSAGSPEVERDHAQDDLGQVGAQDLGGGELGPGEIVLLRVKADAQPRGRRGRSGPCAGRRCCARWATTGMAVVRVRGVVARDAGEARVHDRGDARDGDRGLGHVGGHDDARAPRGRAGGRRGPARRRSGARRAAAPGSPGGASAATASQVSRMSCSVGMKTRVSPARRSRRSRRTTADGLLDGGGLALGPAAVRRLVAHLDRVGPSGDLDHGRVVEGPRELGRVDRGRGDDHPQVAPPVRRACAGSPG